MNRNDMLRILAATLQDAHDGGSEWIAKVNVSETPQGDVECISVTFWDKDGNETVTEHFDTTL